MSNPFNLDVLRTLETLPLAEAKSKATEIMQSMKTKQVVVARLVSDISRAPTSREVSRIVWATYMSGTGFGLIDSSWKKHYKGA